MSRDINVITDMSGRGILSEVPELRQWMPKIIEAMEQDGLSKGYAQYSLNTAFGELLDSSENLEQDYEIPTLGRLYKLMAHSTRRDIFRERLESEMRLFRARTEHTADAHECDTVRFVLGAWAGATRLEGPVELVFADAVTDPCAPDVLLQMEKYIVAMRNDMPLYKAEATISSRIDGGMLAHVIQKDARRMRLAEISFQMLRVGDALAAAMLHCYILSR